MNNSSAASSTRIPKLTRLEEAIGEEADVAKRGCLRAERAGLLARQGFPQPAREALDALRIEFGRNPRLDISIWMLMAEGWMAHYDGDLAASKDRLLRAHALSSAANNSELEALSAAWLAHLAYAQDSFLEMAKYLQVCKTLARTDDHLTQTRLCLVLAQAYHFAHRFDLAQPWYLKARSHALIDKDDAAISVLSYNMASRRSFHLVADSIFAEGTVGEGTLAITGIQSSYNFDQLFGVPLLSCWIQIIHAMAHSARAEFLDALNIYNIHYDEAMKTRLVDQIAFFKADVAWCYANIGMPTKAKTCADEGQKLIGEEMYVEDRVITFGRLAQVYFLLGDKNSADENMRRYKQYHNDLQKMRCYVLQLLDGIK